MNNKRQTIWLVSMLSLMVILSAYYLFTEDVSPTQNAGSSTEQTELGDNAAEASGDAAAQDIQVTEVDRETDSLAESSPSALPDEAAGPAESPAAATEEGNTDETAAESSVSPEDEAVLKDIANLKGAQYFDELQRLELEELDRKSEELNMILADTKNHTQDEASKAFEELAKLEETDLRMTSLEEKLLQDYDNAVVTEDETNFRVVVQAAKLEKKQAVQIIDLAAKELNVSLDRLSVEYVP